MSNQRKQFLIKPAPQLKLILIFFSISCLAVLIQAVMVHLSIKSILADAGGNDYLVAESLPELMSVNLLRTFLILAPVTLLIGSIVTHRIYGPIFRFETFLAQVRDGKAVGPCRIRPADEFQGLCGRINESTESLWSSEEASSDEQISDHRSAA